MIVISQTDPRLVYMNKTEILNGKGFCNVLVDRWFLIHPETEDLIFWQSNKKRQGSLVGASPQCNSNKIVAELIQNKIYPWTKLKFFERVSQPIEVKDYV